MKINRKFIQNNPDEWQRLQADHLAFSRDRHLWRLKLARSKPAGAACAVGIVLIDRFGGVSERNPRGEVFPTQTTIAEETGLSDGEVRYGVDELRRLGLIATRKPALNKSLHYLFTDPDFAVSLRSEATATIREDDEDHHRSEVGTALRSVAPTSVRSVVGTADNLNIQPDEVNLKDNTVVDMSPTAVASLHSDLSDPHMSLVDYVGDNETMGGMEIRVVSLGIIKAMIPAGVHVDKEKIEKIALLLANEEITKSEARSMIALDARGTRHG